MLLLDSRNGPSFFFVHRILSIAVPRAKVVVLVLEGRIEGYQEAEYQAEIHRRRSSTRKSLQLRARNSVRTVTSVQRSLSRPASVVP